MSPFPVALPEPGVPTAMDATPLNWGILGTGWIANNFVSSIQTNTRQHVVSVGSRSLETAEGFAAKHTISRAYGSYADVVNDPEVDIVYVATSHHLHLEHGLLAIEAGKHVLVEKPIALNTADLERLFAAAQAKEVMCQEAFWSFFLPKFDVIRQIVNDGILGEIVTIVADHGEWLPPEHRIHDPQLAGGSLHDLGVYTFAISAWLVGAPTKVLATGRVTDTGVMGDVAVALKGRGEVISSLSTTMVATTPSRAIIAGTLATLTTDEAFFFPGGFTLTCNSSGRSLRYDEPRTRHGALYFEAAEIARRIHGGDLTSPCWTPTDSRNVTAILGAVNAQLGIG